MSQTQIGSCHRLEEGQPPKTFPRIMSEEECNRASMQAAPCCSVNALPDEDNDHARLPLFR